MTQDELFVESPRCYYAQDHEGQNGTDITCARVKDDTLFCTAICGAYVPMPESKKVPLSIRDAALGAMADQFDAVLQKTLKAMEAYREKDGEITVKLKVSLMEEMAPDNDQSAYEAMREVIIPSFSFTVSSVLSIKDSRKGSSGGDYELIWDSEENRYLVKLIDAGQTSLFDEGMKITSDGAGTVVNIEFPQEENDDE